MGAGRIATDVRIGTRIDRDGATSGLNERKVKRVEELRELLWLHDTETPLGHALVTSQSQHLEVDDFNNSKAAQDHRT